MLKTSAIPTWDTLEHHKNRRVRLLAFAGSSSRRTNCAG